MRCASSEQTRPRLFPYYRMPACHKTKVATLSTNLNLKNWRNTTSILCRTTAYASWVAAAAQLHDAYAVVLHKMLVVLRQFFRFKFVDSVATFVLWQAGIR